MNIVYHYLLNIHKEPSCLYYRLMSIVCVSWVSIEWIQINNTYVVFRLDHIPLVTTVCYSRVTICWQLWKELFMPSNTQESHKDSWPEWGSVFSNLAIQLLSQPAPKFFHLHCLFVLFSFQQQKAFLIAYPHSESPLSSAWGHTLSG